MTSVKCLGYSWSSKPRDFAWHSRRLNQPPEDPLLTQNLTPVWPSWATLPPSRALFPWPSHQQLPPPPLLPLQRPLHTNVQRAASLWIRGPHPDKKDLETAYRIQPGCDVSFKWQNEVKVCGKKEKDRKRQSYLVVYLLWVSWWPWKKEDTISSVNHGR